MEIKDAIKFFDTATKLTDFSEAWDCIRKALVEGQNPTTNKQSTQLIMCKSCGINPPDSPSENCCGCDSYSDHY